MYNHGLSRKPASVTIYKTAHTSVSSEKVSVNITYHNEQQQTTRKTFLVFAPYPSHISTSSLKSNISIDFLDPDFL